MSEYSFRSTVTVGNAKLTTNYNPPPDEGQFDGLTKREHFAAMAMQGILAQGGDYDYKSVTSEAVEMADYLIEALNE